MNYWDKATTLYTKGQYKSAIKAYNKYIKKCDKTDLSTVYYNIGICYYKLGYFKESILETKKAILHNNRDSRYYFNIALCYQKLNNNQKAYIYYNIAWSLNENDLECEKSIDKLLGNL